MYAAWYGLRERAFGKTPDPRYLFLNEVYEEALERMVYAVEEMELALLTGEVGSGKTLLNRVEIAGGSRALFTPAAVHAASGGVPRVLNHLATQALLEGMARGARTVDEEAAVAAMAAEPFLEAARG